MTKRLPTPEMEMGQWVMGHTKITAVARLPLRQLGFLGLSTKRVPIVPVSQAEHV